MPLTPRDAHSLSQAALAAASGDRAAFHALHDRLGPWILSLFTSRLQQAGAPPDLAADLSQRTWSAAWAALSGGRYDPSRAAITTFIYAIAHHVWLQHGKTLRRKPAPASLNGAEAHSDSLIDADPSPPAEAELAELIDRVRLCLRGDAPAAGLTPEDSEILTGVGRGESDRALAVRLGVSPSTAHARKRAALDKLRTFLSPLRSRPPAERTARSGE